jgi:hypothetical protein
MSETVISISPGDLSRAAERLLKIVQLVPTPEGMSNEVYITLHTRPGNRSIATLSVLRFGVQVKVRVGACDAQSPTREITLPIPASFLRNINGSGDELLTLTQKHNDAGNLVYKRGRLTGLVALNDPSAMFEAAVADAPTELMTMPLRPLRAALSSTLFASPDPRVQATGPISQLKSLGPQLLLVVTYDSLSGALFQSPTEEVFPEFDLTIPNRILSTIIGQTSEDTAQLGFNERSLLFKARDIVVNFPMDDYPVINVADRIRAITESAQLGFKATPKELIAAIESIVSLAHMDKEIISTELKYANNKLLIQVNSDKLRGKNIIDVTGLHASPFSTMIDSRRLLGFLKPTKGIDSIDMLYNESRLIIKTDQITYAFAGS